MLVICKGYKTCSYRDDCHHSKPHEYKESFDHYKPDCSTIDSICQCCGKFLRSEKLKEIENGNDNGNLYL